VFIDHYSLLETSFGAAPEEIKKNFRRLAKLHHPDRAGGNVLRFVQIYNAYSILNRPEERMRYDRIYRLAKAVGRPHHQLKYHEIAESRLIFPGSLEKMARRGLLRKKFRSRDRRYHLQLDHDMELPLKKDEAFQPLAINLPLVARKICPECLGSDIHCAACNGRGSYKTSISIQIRVEGGLTDGQILELDLSRLKPGSMAHFKRKKLRLKITVRN
jgi:DnaJ-class molecular chaperone